jgi:hypothetical protein
LGRVFGGFGDAIQEPPSRHELVRRTDVALADRNAAWARLTAARIAFEHALENYRAARCAWEGLASYFEGAAVEEVRNDPDPRELGPMLSHPAERETTRQRGE